jgi:hypothetical protein
MLKKTLMTAAAALAIMTGATAVSTSDANAGVKFNIKLGHGYHGGYYGNYYNGYYGGYYGPSCYWKKKRVSNSFWHNGHKHNNWVWRTVKVCY